MATAPRSAETTPGGRAGRRGAVVVRVGADRRRRRSSAPHDSQNRSPVASEAPHVSREQRLGRCRRCRSHSHQRPRVARRLPRSTQRIRSSLSSVCWAAARQADSRARRRSTSVAGVPPTVGSGDDRRSTRTVSERRRRGSRSRPMASSYGSCPGQRELLRRRRRGSPGRRSSRPPAWRAAGPDVPSRRSRPGSWGECRRARRVPRRGRRSARPGGPGRTGPGAV